MDHVRRDPLDEAGDAALIASAEPEPMDTVPLAVDLDGTLVTTDTLFESALSLIRRDAFSLLWFVVWAIRGKAVLKSEIAGWFRLNVENLPYRPALLEYLRSERARGRKIVLATAAHESIAYSVATHLNLFDEVLASTATVNLRGSRKRDALVKRFGVRGFDYIGDSQTDIPVWAACRTGHVAGQLRALPGTVVAAGTREGESFPAQPATLRTWVRAMRVYQWVKNLLVFVPALLNHHVDWEILRTQALTFLGFSLIASGTYIANDLFDLDADRRHPRKCRRPLASGELSIAQGIWAAVLLPLAGLLLGLAVGWPLVACLLAYLFLSSLYSSFLKGKPVIDVIALAVLYTLRLYTGGLVTQAYISPWLFQFSIFFFLSLAFLKRYSELRRVRHKLQMEASGRSYRPPDLSIISQAGLGSGLLAGLVLALYVNGREIERLYPRPEMLWGICPLFIYWITRAWLIAHRGNMHDDPVLFAFRDRVSYIAGGLILILMLLGLIPNAG
jgi:4-hydroxybenzoate polyprenyltransferase